MRCLGGCLWHVDWRGVGSVGVSSCKLRDGAGMERGTLQRKNRWFLTNIRPLDVLMYISYWVISG